MHKEEGSTCTICNEAYTKHIYANLEQLKLLTYPT